MTNSPFAIWLAKFPALKTLPAEVLAEMRAFAEGQIDRVNKLVKIGMALSAEKHRDRLLEMIISEARRLTNADGGTLYIKSETEEVLEFMIIQNDSLHVKMGGTGQVISWPNIALYADGKENHRNVSAHCALTGMPIKIDDVYDAEGFDFQGTKEFDVTTGYRSKSMLLVPMRDHEDEVIGVLQLLNARDRESGEVVGFLANEIEDCRSLASQAAIAVTNMRLIKGLEKLLDSFLRSIAAAIDEKSPYTTGHVQRVAKLTERIARQVNAVADGRLAEVRYDDDELTEIGMAAWMHDVGKITTPEYVVDKSTKLETIFDRIELLRCRMEILKRDHEIARLRAALGEKDISVEPLNAEMAKCAENMDFFEKINIGGEFLADVDIDKIGELAKCQVEINGHPQPLLNADELVNLSIRRGTLTEAERQVINNHVKVTIKMLENLPFPKKMRNVPLYAGMHHEKLDGSGYPRGLYGDDIPLAARMLAVAYPIAALTAAARAYYYGKKLSESMQIMANMVEAGHLDRDLCDLMVERGLVAEFAKAELSDRQLDDFQWNGVVYACH